MSSIAAVEKQQVPFGSSCDATACRQATEAATNNAEPTLPTESAQLEGGADCRRPATHLCQNKTLVSPPAAAEATNLAAGEQTEQSVAEADKTSCYGGQRGDSPQQSGTSRRSSTSGGGGKFKDKRPEPLKLNPNPSQEIPLDLTVKSAGNVPSGMFNLPPSVSSNLETLETPRIQFQEIDAFLGSSKARLISSTSSSASQRARLSSLLGADSPPITPGSPFLDSLLFSPSGGAALRGGAGAANAPFPQAATGATAHSATLIPPDSPLRGLIASPFDLNKLRILDKWAQSNRSLLQHYLRGGDSAANRMATPRRSCSSDSLNFLCGAKQLHQQQGAASFLHEAPPNGHSFKLRVDCRTGDQSDESPAASGHAKTKNSISPLATKSLSNSAAAAKFSLPNQPTKFPYTSSQQACAEPIKTPPTVAGAAAATQTCNGLQNQSRSPTNVACATANFLNIRLSSPTNQPQEQLFGADQQLHENKLASPLLSAAYNFKSSLGNISSLNLADSTNTASGQQHQTAFSLRQQPGGGGGGGSTSLNTPTLCSPQLKAGGALCFLPSPTLSPSVFEPPSPLLMFAQPHQQTRAKLAASPTATPTLGQAAAVAATAADTCGMLAAARDNFGYSSPAAAMKLELAKGADNCGRSIAQLITSATDKFPNQIDRDERLARREDDDVGQDDDSNNRMDVDENDENVFDENGCRREALANSTGRPATVIPQIYVSNCRAAKCDQQQFAELETRRWPPASGEQPSGACGLQQQQSKSSVSLRPLGGEPVECRTQQRQQRDLLARRALSPKSFRARVNLYHSERLESSSAPPRIFERRAKSRIRTAAGQSPACCCENSSGASQHSTSYPQQDYASNQQQTKPPCQTGCGRCWDSTAAAATRSSSAEPQTCAARAAYLEPAGKSVALAHNLAGCGFSQSEQQLSFGGCATPQAAYNPVGPFSRCASQRQPAPAAQQPFDQLANSGPNQQQLHSVSADSLHSLQGGRQPPPPLQSSGYESFQQTGGCQPQTCAQRSQSATGQRQCIPNGSNSSTNAGAKCDLPETFEPPFGFSSRLLYATKASNNKYSEANSNDADCGGRTPAEQASSQTRPTLCSSAGALQLFDQTAAAALQVGSRSSSAASSTSAPKKYHCDQCAKSFTRSDMLTRHRRLHSGDRPFQCGECKQEFSRSDHLSTHMRTHTGEKPYKCKVCYYTACRKDMITRHMKVHTRGAASGQCLA